MSADIVQENQAADPRLEELFKAGVHFGYAKTRRHPRMRDFVAGVKSNIEIFHLERIWEQLEKALAFVESLGKEGGSILWVGSKPAAQGAIREAAEELGHPYVDIRWIGGTLTNSKVIRERINYWQNLVAQKKTGELAKYTKQEQLMISRKVERMERAFGGLVTLIGMPKAVIIIDTNEEFNALAEAKAKNIPVAALMNTDCDPADVAYPIPGNDNAPKSIHMVIETLKASYLKGKKDAGN